VYFRKPWWIWDKLAVGMFWKALTDLSQTHSGVFEEEPEALVGELTRGLYLL
jgi:hypothetical protein